MKEQEFKKMRRDLGTSRTTLNVPTSDSGLPEGKGEEQEIENIFRNIMKENAPNLAKEIDFQEVQDVRESQEIGSKEEHTKTHQNYITQD